MVASELKKLNPDLKLIYIGHKGDSLADIPANAPNIDKSYSVRAGKFRRYKSEGLKQLLDIPTIIKNVRDVLFIVVGLFQSYFLIKKLKPDVVFSRGGYVSVPVCLGAKLNGVNYLTHDSGPVPSLANRLIGRWAKYHLVSADKDIYPYPAAKTITTGVPVSRSFVRVTKEVQGKYRQKLNISEKAKMIFVIGGGLGAQSINEALHEVLPNLLAEFKDLKVVHVVGGKNFDEARKAYEDVLTADQKDRVEVLDFTDQVYLYSGAADVVITRAGSTNLAEFEIQGAPCIIIPGDLLIDQLENIKLLKDSNAAVFISDAELAENPHVLSKEISLLLRDAKKRQKLGDGLAKFGYPNGGEKIAKLIIETAET
ncbi:MAG TPA: UDP-N-acetylglucosamine--N-acetylmuramyl-(pentapeptide) pyrophosphoryl-undecaprenol N-acetylglucosamine transferase [Candidatus Saccharimonadales bacterium]